MEYYEKSQTKRYASTPLGNEIRITSHGRVRVLVSRVLDKIKKERLPSVVLKGEAQTVTKAITCAEIVKRKMPTLHQATKVKYSKLEEMWSPKDEKLGLETLQVTRSVPAIDITLSIEALDATADGYQAPLSPVKSRSRSRTSDKPVRQLSEGMQDDLRQFVNTGAEKGSKKRVSSAGSSGKQHSTDIQKSVHRDIKCEAAS